MSCSIRATLSTRAVDVDDMERRAGDDGVRDRLLDSLDPDAEGGRRAALLTALITSGVHAKALANGPDVIAAIRDLAHEPIRVPHWAIPLLTW